MRQLLRSQYPEILAQFTALEKPDISRISDIRLARKAGGFAFEYWCQGGDLKDIDRLLQHFEAVLNRSDSLPRLDPRQRSALGRLRSNISINVETLQSTSDDDNVWNLGLSEREELLSQWGKEISAQGIVDRVAEIHRRHQTAVFRKRRVQDEFDRRMLENGAFRALFQINTNITAGHDQPYRYVHVEHA